MKKIIAILYAMYHHRGQKRKGSTLPYILHPLKVALLLRDGGASGELQIAAILHDLLEDTKASEKTMRFLFGDYITFLVMSVSKNYATHTFDIKSNKDSRALKTADSAQNLLDCLYNPGQVSARKFDEYLRRLLSYRGSVSTLKDVRDICARYSDGAPEKDIKLGVFVLGLRKYSCF